MIVAASICFVVIACMLLSLIVLSPRLSCWPDE